MEDQLDLRWRKSSYSANGGGNCVEVASHDGMILVRDSKNPGPVHRYTGAEWRTFLDRIRNGEPTPASPGPLR
jgi:Domain of unknown function (DUF397)